MPRTRAGQDGILSGALVEPSSHESFFLLLFCPRLEPYRYVRYVKKGGTQFDSWDLVFYTFCIQCIALKMASSFESCFLDQLFIRL